MGGPPRDVVRPFPVPQPVLQQVVRPVPGPLKTGVPVPRPAPGKEIVVGVRDNRMRIENEILKKEISYLESVKRPSSRRSRRAPAAPYGGYGGYGAPMYGTFNPNMAAPMPYGAAYPGFNGYNTLN